MDVQVLVYLVKLGDAPGPMVLLGRVADVVVDAPDHREDHLYPAVQDGLFNTKFHIITFRDNYTT